MPATLHQLRSEQTREPLLAAAIALMDTTGSGRWLAETLCPRAK